MTSTISESIDLEASVSGLTASMTSALTAPGAINDQLAELAAQAGFQATVGTVAFAGEYATGAFAVQFNNQNGGFSSVWPQWAFELAKDALLGGKRLWVASNGDPFGSNLVFVLILP
jgi:hypothetical protein